MVTIKQIAERCGVSISTVSKALNGADDVGQATMNRIRKTAEEMGYMPNSAARALKTRRSYSFGIYFSAAEAEGLTHEFFARILNSFKARSEELGYDILFIGERLGKRKLSLTEHARYRNCDGVLIVSGSDEDEAESKTMGKTDIPTVCIDYSYENTASIASDNERGMRELTEYIISLGHSKIAFVYGQNSLVTRTRIKSFVDTCRAHGIEVPEGYLVPGYYHDAANARAAARKLMELPDPPSCILFPDDFSAMGGISELGAMGYSVPKDVSAAGYDGLSLCQAFTPQLTTMWQNAEAMGRSSAEELARLIEEGSAYGCRRILIPGVLMPGETVRCLES